MDQTKSTTVVQIFDAQAIVKNTTVYSDIFDVTKLAGNASLHITDLTGDGTCKLEWVGSNNEDAVVADFIKVNNANDIVTAFTKTSGPGGDGEHIYPFNISLVQRMAIKATETGTASDVAVTAIIALQ